LTINFGVGMIVRLVLVTAAILMPFAVQASSVTLESQRAG
jgi:hypothetical protein